MPAVLTGTVAIVLGGMLLGVAVTAQALAWRWALEPPQPGPRQVVRAALGVFAALLLLAGLVLATNGLEALAGYPLGRWSGATMVLDLWIALEVLVRDTVVTAALARSRVLWAVAALAFVVAKAALVLTAFVTLWSLLGA